MVDGWNGERQKGEKLEDIEEKHIERYRFAQKYCNNKSVLDAACGVGYGSNILAQKASSVLGVDFSKEAIEYARKHWISDKISFKQFDLNSDLYDLGMFDVIVSIETIEHLDTDINKTCKKFYDILQSGGVLIISHPENEISPRKDRKGIGNLVLKPVEFFLRIKNKQEKTKTFHKHFNIKGEQVKQMIQEIGFQIKDEWRQPSRYHYHYHQIVGEKP